MKRIADIRRGLRSIPDALTDIPPENTYRASLPGVEITTIHETYDPTLQTDGFINVENDNEQNEDSVPELAPLFEIGADVDDSFPALGGEEGENIRSCVRLRGMDAIGAYLSFHVVGAQWGIYVPISGMVYLMKYAFSELPAPLEAKASLAFHAILSHELFHFATDLMVSQAELAHQEPWWLPAQQAVRSGRPGYCVVEERLANAYMLSAFRATKASLRIPKRQEALRGFTLLQPEGYCEGWGIKRQQWESELACLAAEYGGHSNRASKIGSLWQPVSSYDWSAQFPIRPKIDWRYCPIHLVHDGERLGIPRDWLNAFGRIPFLTESPKFCEMLKRLAQPIQKAWARTKLRLSEAITPGMDFKPWPKAGRDIFSIRVNDTVRAHLQHERTAQKWMALEIGGHKELGHG